MFTLPSGIIEIPSLGHILTGPTDEVTDPARLPRPDEIDTVLYHRDCDRDCADGTASAWSAWKRRGESARYIPFGYDDPLPDVRGKKVAMLDVHRNRPFITRLLGEAEAFILLDHHATGKEWLEGLPNVLVDQTHSGAWLSWKYFHPDKEVPTLIDYVQDQDLWQWALPDSRLFFSALELYPRTIAGFEEASQQDFSEMVAKGRIVHQHVARIVDQILHTVLMQEWHGQKTAVINSSIFPGEIADAIFKRSPDLDVALVWYLNKDGKIKVMLRSRDENVNVKDIAKKYPGGGGHNQASGFTYPSSDIKHVLKPPPTHHLRMLLQHFLDHFRTN